MLIKSTKTQDQQQKTKTSETSTGRQLWSDFWREFLIHALAIIGSYLQPQGLEIQILQTYIDTRIHVS